MSAVHVLPVNREIATDTLSQKTLQNEDCRLQVLLLTSSMLTDRMLFYSNFLNTLNSGAETKIWATSHTSTRESEETESDHRVENFPSVLPFREFPYNYLRRMNEFVWDYIQRPPSRLSMMRHVRNRNQHPLIRALKLPARLLALLRVEQRFETYLEKLLLNYLRSSEALHRLSTDPPAVLVTTGPHRFEEPAVVAVAKTLSIPTLAFITSWDNISTKNRMVFKYDGYLVWSEKMKQELHRFYPQSRQVPVYVVGAPQFDIFFQQQFYQPREVFCADQGLRLDRPIIVYAVGSPNFIRGEYHGAVDMAKRVACGALGDVQLIIRPHPLFDNREFDALAHLGSQIIVQKTGAAGMPLTSRTQNESQIVEWVNTFRHADVVVNLASTVTVDAALCDLPVVNLDFDPEPGQPNQQLIKDVNHVWTHFKPVAESGGVWLVNDMDELLHAVRTYLAHPELHREKRRWSAEHVCGYIDGRCGERMAKAILDFANTTTGINTARATMEYECQR